MSQRLSAMDIVELFEKDVRARKRLAELLAVEPDVRLAIINAVLRDVATKQDVEKLGQRLEELRKDIGELRERVARLESRVDLLIKVFIGFNIPLLVAVIGILLKMIIAP